MNAPLDLDAVERAIMADMDPAIPYLHVDAAILKQLIAELRETRDLLMRVPQLLAPGERGDALIAWYEKHCG